ncbi:MAG: hypothetical protein HQK49_16435 [Oligoflexia bacterium]|nr:hypothetical protein [Oligoflexia bacterium]
MRVVLVFIVFLFVTSPLPLSAQNERFIRDMFANQINKQENYKSYVTYKWLANTPFYQIDLTADGVAENILVSKRDAEDWFVVTNSKRIPVLEFKMDRVGVESFVYKVRVVRISASTVALIIFHYQGYYKEINFLGKSKIYFVTIDDNDLKKINYSVGPTIWEEKETYPHRYSQRFYDVRVNDLNSDNVKEIIVSYGRNSHIFSYLGNGQWRNN